MGRHRDDSELSDLTGQPAEGCQSLDPDHGRKPQREAIGPCYSREANAPHEQRHLRVALVTAGARAGNGRMAARDTTI
jgi:hypothetical protein